MISTTTLHIVVLEKLNPTMSIHLFFRCKIHACIVAGFEGWRLKEERENEKGSMTWQTVT